MSKDEANRITNDNIAQNDNFMFQQEIGDINREINKAIRKRRFNTQFTYLLSAAAITVLTNAGYTVGQNDYGTYVSWS